MSMDDRFEVTLDEDTEKRLFELLTSMDTRKTDHFWITDKYGYHAEYVKVIKCENCKFAHLIYPHDDWWECEHDKRVLHSNGFCSWAERKEK